MTTEKRVGARRVIRGLVGDVGAAPSVISVLTDSGDADFVIGGAAVKPAGVAADETATIALVAANDRRRVDIAPNDRLTLPQAAVASPYEFAARVAGLLPSAEYQFFVRITWSGGARAELTIDAAKSPR